MDRNGSLPSIWKGENWLVREDCFSCCTGGNRRSAGFCNPVQTCSSQLLSFVGCAADWGRNLYRAVYCCHWLTQTDASVASDHVLVFWQSGSYSCAFLGRCQSQSDKCWYICCRQQKGPLPTTKIHKEEASRIGHLFKDYVDVLLIDWSIHWLRATSTFPFALILRWQMWATYSELFFLVILERHFGCGCGCLLKTLGLTCRKLLAMMKIPLPDGAPQFQVALPNITIYYPSQFS